MKVKVRIEFLDEKNAPVEVKPWETPFLHLEEASLKHLRNAIGTIIDSILRLPSRFPQPPEKKKGDDGPDTAECVA